MLTIRFHLIALAVAAFYAGIVKAGTHIVSFVNNCGHGFPSFEKNGEFIGLDEYYTYTSYGPITNTYAYLDTGNLISDCGRDGAGCTAFKFTLKNGDSEAIYALNGFNVPASFQYYNGCSGSFDCANENCGAINIHPIDCSAKNVDIRFTFC